MRKRLLRTGAAALAVVGMALVVGAQGPPGPGGFGGPGPWMGGPGVFEFGGLVGGFGGKTVTGKPLQATFTITRNEELAGGNSITNTTTGTLARGTDGSSFRQVKLPAIGPWASSGKVPEFHYIRNLSTSTQYIVNVMKGTYESSPIGEHKSPPGGGPEQFKQGKGPDASGPNEESVTDNPDASYTDPGTGTVYNSVDDRKTTRTIPAGEIGNASPIVITSERWYSAALGLVLKQTRSDPRFGTTTYVLSNIVLGQPPASLFVPNPAFTQVEGKKFGRRGFKGEDNPPPPPPGD